MKRFYFLILFTFSLFVGVNFASAVDCYEIDGLSVFGYDGSDYVFIGAIVNEYSRYSIANEYGSYGSDYSSTSMFNDWSRYGNDYGLYSAFNDYASKPPVLIDDDLNVVGYVTMNDLKLSYVTPYEALYCAKESYKSANLDLVDFKFSDFNKTSSFGSSGFDINAYCKLLYGEYSYGIGDSCYCNNDLNYYWNDGQTACVYLDRTSVCKLSYGENVWGDQDGCYCVSGYELSIGGDSCVLKELQCPANSYKGVDEKCYCNVGYKLNDSQDGCVVDNNVLRPLTLFQKSYYINDLSSRVNYAGKVIYTDKPKNIPIGYMIKAHSDPKCYAVMGDGTLRWVMNEYAAKRMFGDDWDDQIIWLEESLVYTYPFGDNITQ